MKLYGTPTSPYVRRVHALALELGVAVELIDTRAPEGQAGLKQHTPIWKVPIAISEGTTVFDSHGIIDFLIERHGFGPLRESKDPVEERNLIHVIDGALDAGIRCLYAARDGIAPDSPFVTRERERMASCLAWLEEAVNGAYCTHDERFGLAELALVTTLDWMRFRKTYDIDAQPKLAAFGWAHKERASLVATAPSEA